VVAVLAGASACGDEGNSVDPDDRLCNGETGVGLWIEGRAQRLEFCVDDADVSAIVTAGDRYDVEAQLSTSEGVFIVRMVFAVRSFPARLRVTADLAEAIADLDAVWLYYEEIPKAGSQIESFAVDSGSFNLSFVDEDVAAGVLADVSLRMRDFGSGDPAGGREFSEGMFSISSKEPTVTSTR
jgi:hypothetical protein